MNTIDKWLTTATIHDDHRRTVWSTVFPGATVPIKSIMTCKVNVPGHQNADAYMLDLDALTHDQIVALSEMISDLFQLPLDEVRKDIYKGVPILAEGVSVGTADPGVFFSMIDDDLHGDEWDLDEDLFHHQEWEED